MALGLQALRFINDLFWLSLRTCTLFEQSIWSTAEPAQGFQVTQSMEPGPITVVARRSFASNMGIVAGKPYNTKLRGFAP